MEFADVEVGLGEMLGNFRSVHSPVICRDEMFDALYGTRMSFLLK